VGISQYAYFKDPKKVEQKNVWKFLYDKDQNTICSRTPLSWLQITAFFVTLYLFLAGFSALWWWVMVQNGLSVDMPKYTGTESLIAGFGNVGIKPGLGLRPRPDRKDIKAQDKHIIFYLKDTTLNEYWTNQVKKFFDMHLNQTDTMECGEFTHHEQNEKVCAFNYTQLGSCGIYPYGYSVGTSGDGKIEPCIFITVNRVLGFHPETYDYQEDRFKNVPKSVNTTVLEQRMKLDGNKIYIECHTFGENEVDEYLKIQEHLVFHPNDGGISFRHFPYHQTGGGRGDQRQQSPFVALQFKSSFPRGTEFSIECFPYYKNVVHDRKTRQGLIRFKIRIDE
jgi:hypothetical protein